MITLNQRLITAKPISIKIVGRRCLAQVVGKARVGCTLAFIRRTPIRRPRTGPTSGIDERVIRRNQAGVRIALQHVQQPGDRMRLRNVVRRFQR